MTFTEAAVLMLRVEGKPLTWRKLAELAVRHELLSHVGTDPGETMRVRLSDIVRRQGDTAPFVEGKGGVYSLREWRGSSPGPSAKAQAELEAYKADHAVPAAAPAAAHGGGAARRKERGHGSEGGREGRGRGPRGRKSGRGRSEGATKGAGVETTNEREEGGSGTRDEGSAEVEPSAGAGEDGAGMQAAESGNGPAETADAAGRPGEGRKRRRRGRRGRGGVGAGAEPAADAAPQARTAVAPSAPQPAAQPAAPVVANRSGRAPSPPVPAVGPSVACVPCDLGRVAEGALRLLRGQSQHRSMRANEILAAWASRGAPEAKLPPAALAAALGAADASTRVGAGLVSLTGGRWAPTEWAWGDEPAALEKKVAEAAAQHLAAVRRTLLRRLAEMPLAAFQQIVVALLAAEGFRDIRPVEDAPANGGDPLLLRARMPYGPAEIAMVVLVVRGAPGRFVTEEQVAALRGRLPRTGACGGAIVTTGRVCDMARRDLVPPNAIPLLAIEQEALADRLLGHRIGVRVRCLEVPALDPDALGGLGEGDRG